jgi:hypothetical protein
MMRKPVMSLENHDQLPSSPREWIDLEDVLWPGPRAFILTVGLPCDIRLSPPLVCLVRE